MVSVVIPTRNRAAYLDVALASLVSQACDHEYEVLVVDDRSTDGTAAVARKWDVRYVRPERSRGLNAARNAGVAASTGELVAFLDDDVFAPPGWLQALIDGAARHPHADAFGGAIRARFEGKSPSSCGRESAPITTLDLGERDIEAPIVWGSNMAVRRAALQRHGPFDESVAGHGDEEDWLIALRAAGGTIVYLAHAGIEHRRAGTDAALPALTRAAYRRGRAARISDQRRGTAPTLARELRVLAGCAWHGVRYACPQGLIMGAHSAGRIAHALGGARGLGSRTPASRQAVAEPRDDPPVMRVLVVPKWYPWPDRPVLGAFCREHARAIATAHDVVVLASDAVRSPPFAAFEISDAAEEDLRTLRVRYRRPRFRPAAMLFQIAGMLVAQRRLSREGWAPQIVHAHVYSAGVPALILGGLSRAPVVVSEHYTGFQRGLISGYDRLTARITFRYADLVAPVSENLARFIRALEPRARIRVIGNVVDTDAFHPPSVRPSRNGPVKLLTVAALTPKKGHADLLEAVAKLHDAHDLVLDLASDGELRDQLEAQARRLGISGRVRFHGVQPKARIAQMMREADLFVLPSRVENQPCVLLEAMASGLPSVATAVGDVPELIGGSTGFLCPPADPDALARTIAQAIEHRRDSDPDGLAAGARRRFGYEPMTHAWTEVYAQLRADRPSPRRSDRPSAWRRWRREA